MKLFKRNENKNVVNKSASELRIIKLGSEIGATKNMTVYECGEDIIVVDCGIGFPDSDLLGVDVVIPDVTYLKENIHRVRGLFVTHGHEDHHGAIAYVINELNVPIYANELVQGFIKARIVDRTSKQVLEDTSFNLINTETDPIELGNFTIEAFNVNHSVPTSLGFAIKTPQGTVLHMADFKIDWSPVIDEPIDMGAIAKYADEGVLCLLSDCLGVTHEGYSASEKSLYPTYDYLFEQAQGRQIFITTISSNISRVHQIVELAIKHNRKVVFAGRSLKQSSDIARSLGLLPFDDDVFVDLKKAKRFDKNDLVYIVAGCYGQPGSALYRLAHDDHNQLQLQEDDLVVFSADPGPPSSYEPVENILHYLTVAGAEVVYSKIQDNLHVSGHGTRGDLQTVAALTKSKYYMPIGGTAAKMRAYSNMVGELGVPRENCIELLEGHNVIFKNNEITYGDPIPVKQVYVEGSTVGEVGEVVIRDREKLSDDGVLVAVVPISKETNKLQGKVEIVTRGFVYVKESKALLGMTRDAVYKSIDKYEDLQDWANIKYKIEKDVQKFLEKETGRQAPLIIISSVRVE